MAALTEAQIELANTLTAAELPTKLRCAVCSKLAINAFRLPCCETAICEKCQSTLPSVCPVCEHSPVSASDCTVYKSLRTTIRVFLKTEEKKREAARPKANGSPATPAQDTPTPAPAQAQAQPVTEPPPVDTAVPERDGSEPQTTNSAAHTAVIESIELPTTDTKLDDDTPPQEGVSVNGQAQEQPVGDDESKALVSNEQEGQELATLEETEEKGQGEEDNDQTAQSGMGGGFDSMAGNFNMNFGNGDMNQMQMLMAMQNGMNPAAFGSFPMMGMMDPMTMQNMMMSGGFGAQGMGMNGMNMNMGMNGFNGGGNDWNGQQSWNVGQDNFNPNTRGMGNGDFGNFNSGFRTGFNSGNYGHNNQFNDYRRGNYGFRGRGRGRGFHGGHGRGYHHGYNNANAGWAGQGSQFSNGSDGQAALDDSQETGQMSGNVDEFGRAIRPESNEGAQNAGEDEHVETKGSHDSTAVDGTDKLARENSEQAPKGDRSQSIQGDLADDKGDVSFRDQHSTPQGPARGSAGQIQPQTAAPDVPLNAPTGPKAMRQGLPNTSLHNLRARGFIPDETSQSSRTNQHPVVASPKDDKLRSRSSSPHTSKDKDRRPRESDREHVDDEKDRARRRDRDRDRSKTYTVSKSRSRSRSRGGDRKESRKHRRHRSPSIPGGDRDSGHRRRRHKSDRRQSTRDDDDYRSRQKDEKHEEHSRSVSPVDREHKRSGHRSRRDRDDKRRDRDRDVDRDSDYDRHRKSGHRSHRDRDRGQDRERNRERETDRDREYTRDRDEDRHRHSRKNSTAVPPPAEPSTKTFNPPTGPRGANFSIKGASNKPGSSGIDVKGSGNRPSNQEKHESEPSRRPSQSSATGQKPTAGGPSKDPHTLEREARNRERLLKEAQRMAVIAGRGGGVKRGRETSDDRGGSRRKSRRSEAVNTEDEEGRMRRLEAEREGRRWD